MSTRAVLFSPLDSIAEVSYIPRPQREPPQGGHRMTKSIRIESSQLPRALSVKAEFCFGSKFGSKDPA